MENKEAEDALFYMHEKARRDPYTDPTLIINYYNGIRNYIESLEELVKKQNIHLRHKDKALDKACEKLAYINSIRFTCEEDRCNRKICDACCNNECNDSSAWKEWCEHRTEKAFGKKGIELNLAKEHIKEIVEDVNNEEEVSL